jgi:hypothetical protein
MGDIKTVEVPEVGDRSAVVAHEAAPLAETEDS